MLTTIADAFTAMAWGTHVLKSRNLNYGVGNAVASWVVGSSNCRENDTTPGLWNIVDVLRTVTAEAKTRQLLDRVRQDRNVIFSDFFSGRRG